MASFKNDSRDLALLLNDSAGHGRTHDDRISNCTSTRRCCGDSFCSMDLVGAPIGADSCAGAAVRSCFNHMGCDCGSGCLLTTSLHTSNSSMLTGKRG